MKSWNFEISYQVVFSIWTKVQEKNLISWEGKELSRWNKKQFFVIFKGLSLKQIKQFSLEGESPTLKHVWLFLNLIFKPYAWTGQKNKIVEI